MIKTSLFCYYIIRSLFPIVEWNLDYDWKLPLYFCLIAILQQILNNSANFETTKFASSLIIKKVHKSYFHIFVKISIFKVTRLKTFQSITAFWLNFELILTAFWLNFELILTAFWVNFDCISTEFWLHFGCILIEFWLHFNWILMEILLYFGWILTAFRLNFDWNLATFWLHFDS